MRHSLRALRAVSLLWLIVLVPILAGSSAGADGSGMCNDPNCAAAPAAARAPNRAPRARNDAATTARDTTVTINVTANDSDPDGRIVRRTVRILGAGPRNGRAGKRRNGTVVYAPDTGFVGQDTFRYRVKDNRGALSNRARVRVTVLASARSPVANNDTAATAIDTPVVINVVANDTDADGNLDPRSVAIATNPATGRLVNRFDGSVTYTPSAGFFGTDGFGYTVRDAEGATSNVARVTVTVGPVAMAGPDRNAVTGQPVTLNGSGSFDPDGNPLAFSWQFVSVPTVPAPSALTSANIVNPTSSAPSFTPDVAGAYELELRVTDGTLSDTDRVVITAAPDGQVPPNANAGPDQSAQVSTVVTLNGSASNDPDNAPSPLTFSWAFAERPVGSAATLTNATTAQPSFTPDVVGIYRVTLTVSDGNFSGQDEVVITATAPPTTTTTTLPQGTTTTTVPQATTTTVPTTTTTTLPTTTTTSTTVTTMPTTTTTTSTTTTTVRQPVTVNADVGSNFFRFPSNNNANNVTIQRGDTVRFTNQGGSHDVRIDNGSMDGLLIGPINQPLSDLWTFERRFDGAGVVLINCSVHSCPASQANPNQACNTMNGRITVE